MPASPVVEHGFAATARGCCASRIAAFVAVCVLCAVLSVATGPAHALTSHTSALHPPSGVGSHMRGRQLSGSEDTREAAEEEQEMLILLTVFGIVMLCTLMAGVMACLRVARGSHTVHVINRQPGGASSGGRLVMGQAVNMLPANFGSAQVPVGTRAEPARWLPDKAKPDMPDPRRSSRNFHGPPSAPRTPMSFHNTGPAPGSLDGRQSVHSANDGLEVLDLEEVPLTTHRSAPTTPRTPPGFAQMVPARHATSMRGPSIAVMYTYAAGAGVGVGAGAGYVQQPPQQQQFYTARAQSAPYRNGYVVPVSFHAARTTYR